MATDMKQPNVRQGTHGKGALKRERIERFLTTEFCGRELACFDELESTNFSARELAKVGYPAGTLVVCGHQTSGRGRREKKWISLPGESVCMSLILRPKIAAENATRYTIASAVAVCESLGLYCMHDTKVKWPNDIVHNHKKLAGILLEGSFSSGMVDYVVIGIGINVLTHDFYGDIRNTATSIFQSTGVRVLRERVIANIVNHIEPLLPMCESDEGFSDILARYKAYSDVLGEEVRIMTATQTYNGVALDFDERGCIIIKLDSGEICTFDSGDVSLRRGEYGSYA